MGALTISERTRPQFTGQLKRVRAKATPSSSYATGGETFTPGNFGLSRIEHVEIEPSLGSTTGYLPVWNESRTAPKIVMLCAGTTAGDPLPEETAATNLTTFPFRMIVTGV